MRLDLKSKTDTVISRRTVLTGLAASAACRTAPGAFATEEDGLNAHAARRGMSFGSAVQAQQLKTVPGLAAAIVRDCSIIVPEIEMKWGFTEPVRNKPDYSAADEIARFAAKHGIQLRGHTALWYHNIPKWTKKALAEPTAHDVLIKRVSDIVGHFRGRVVEWDVINELIEPRAGRPDGLRNFPAYKPGDMGLFTACFHTAREADPQAKLFYNDFGLEYHNENDKNRRKAAIYIMSELEKRNAPIDGFGIQSHLVAGWEFRRETFRSFLTEIASFKVKISLTEFDIDDSNLPADIAKRDAMVAEHARDYLDAAFTEPAVTRLLTWSLSDPMSWLNFFRPRKDKLMTRSLPLDDKLARKPLWHAIADSFDNTSTRR